MRSNGRKPVVRSPLAEGSRDVENTSPASAPSKEKIIGDKHIGMIRLMNCKMEAKIVRYRSNTDMDVEFVDGTVVEHCRLCNFNQGCVGNPNVKTPYKELPKITFESPKAEAPVKHLPSGERFEKSKREKLGEVRKMKCGKDAKIIAYRGYSDIDVQFLEDGLIVEGRGYGQFKTGSILHPSMKKGAEKKALKTPVKDPCEHAIYGSYGSDMIRKNKAGSY
jgi:hypothetical protein